MNVKLTTGTLLALMVMPFRAQAAGTMDSDSGTHMFSFSAFGTLGEVHSSQDKADFNASVFQPNGAGYTHRWSASVDSLIGAQLTANIAPKLSAVLQVIAQQDYDGTYRPHVEWANLKYQFTPDLSMRIGRTELPTFLFSDTRKVGYTYPWVRPPIEVYSLLPISASDGAGFSYRVILGELSNTTQGSYAQSKTEQPDHRGTAIARGSFNLSTTTEYESFTVRVFYQTVRLTVTSIDPLLDAFRMFGSEGVAIADKYSSNGKRVATEVIGANYDPGHWFLIGEWGHAGFNSFLGEQTAWYGSGGYRVGKFTPYVTYAQERAASNSDPGLTLAGLPPAKAGFAAGLNSGLNAVLQSIPDQNTASFGVRWDFMKNLDLKLQVDHTRLGAESTGTLFNIQPGLHPGATVNLFSATLNFVY